MNQSGYKWRREYWGGEIMLNRIDETGNQYGEWIILEYIPPEKREKPKSTLNYLA